jgi:predicted GIY-YIG superfamily endonuclease
MASFQKTTTHPKVCILNEDDARSLTYGGIAHKCSSRRHHHYSKSKADALVKAGELVWLGKHKKVATFQNARSWIKTYTAQPVWRSDYVRDAAGSRRGRVLTTGTSRSAVRDFPHLPAKTKAR